MRCGQIRPLARSAWQGSEVEASEGQAAVGTGRPRRRLSRNTSDGFRSVVQGSPGWGWEQPVKCWPRGTLDQLGVWRQQEGPSYGGGGGGKTTSASPKSSHLINTPSPTTECTVWPGTWHHHPLRASGPQLRNRTQNLCHSCLVRSLCDCMRYQGFTHFGAVRSCAMWVLNIAWVQLLAPLHSSCVIVGKSLDHSEP